MTPVTKTLDIIQELQNVLNSCYVIADRIYINLDRNHGETQWFHDVLSPLQKLTHVVLAFKKKLSDTIPQDNLDPAKQKLLLEIQDAAHSSLDDADFRELTSLLVKMALNNTQGEQA